MKPIFFLTSFIVLHFNLAAATENPAEVNQPFAVVELFASEGCSSCPPADELLRRITEQARRDGKRVFPLSFQVDYWNELGWVDPFSSPRFTERERRYAKILGTRSVYTPQMIINGMNVFVGSDQNLAEKYINQYLEIPSLNTITLEIKKKGARQIEVNYRCESLTPETVLNFALVERGFQNNVTAGENAGRLLRHDNVVLEFKTIPFTEKEGRIIFEKPNSDDPSRFSIIVYLQNPNDMKITAANSVDLS